MLEPIWSLERGMGPCVATALHDGHAVRPGLRRYLALDESQRLREEDPFTGTWTQLAPTRIVGLRSRFEVDLNRPRDKAVYLTAEDAWGLRVWQDELPQAEIAASLAEYDAFYAALHAVYSDLADRYGAFVVYDLHSYNHCRDGRHGIVADPQFNPQVNVGTGTMLRRDKFAGVVARFQHELSRYDFPGGRLDVRENVRFFGGNHPRWAHETFPDSACVLAIEVKKFFMDEWSGEADHELLAAIPAALSATVPGILEELARLSG